MAKVNDPFPFFSKSAQFSDDRIYRYQLFRAWDMTKSTIAFIGLNPSTADENILDPTIRKCCIWARNWGYGSLLMGNLYAFRSTDPRRLKDAMDPIGPINDDVLRKLTSVAVKTVVAWGANADPERAAQVLKILDFASLYCLGKNKNGSPKHPLYLKMNTQLMIYLGARY